MTLPPVYCDVCYITDHSTRPVTKVGTVCFMRRQVGLCLFYLSETSAVITWMISSTFLLRNNKDKLLSSKDTFHAVVKATIS